MNSVYEIDFASVIDGKADVLQEIIQDLISVHWAVIDPVNPPSNKIRSFLSDLIREAIFASSLIDNPKSLEAAPMAKLFIENQPLTFDCMKYIFGMEMDEEEIKQIADKHKVSQLATTLRIKKLKQTLGLEVQKKRKK